MTQVLNRKVVDAVVCAAVLIVVGFTVFPGDAGFARGLSQYAPHVTMSLLAGGLLAMLLRGQRAMITLFAGAAFLSLVLRAYTSDASPELADIATEVMPSRSFEVAQFSTSNLAQRVPYGLNEITSRDADVVAVYSLTPEWNEYLCDQLYEEYPHCYTYEDIGLQGIGLFSRYPLGHVDSVHVNGIVHVEACVPGAYQGEDINLVAVQTLPPVSPQGFSTLRRHLAHVGVQIETASMPTVVVGDFNATPWSSEVAQFRDITGLYDTRQNAQSTFVQGVPQFFEVPVEHIFYSDHLRCVRHLTLRSEDGYLGNGAIFQARTRGDKLVAL